MANDVLTNNTQAGIVVRDYVCSRCWGHLTQQHGPNRTWIVRCPNPDCNGVGFVTRGYAERRQAESFADLAEARHNLKDIIPTKEDNKTESELIDELGF